MPDVSPAATRINGVTMTYTDRGEGPVLLLLHGHAYDRSMWARQVEVFADRGWRVVAELTSGMVGDPSLGRTAGTLPE